MKRLLLIILAIGLSQTAFAGDFSIDPLRVEIEAGPGAKVSGFYTITNVAGQDINVAVMPKEYFTLDENKKFGAKWLKFRKNIIKVKKGDSVQIQYSITVPRKAQGFLMLLNSFGSQKLDDKGEIEPQMLNMVSSVPVYVFIKGRQKIEGSIDKMQIAGGSSGVAVMVSVKNSGNVYLRPSGSAEIRQGEKVVGTIQIKEGMPVFPGGSESYQGSSADITLASGDYTLTAVMRSALPVLEMADTKAFSVTKEGGIKAK